MMGEASRDSEASQPPEQLLRQAVPQIAMGYQMYRDWKSAGGYGPSPSFSEREVAIFQWKDTHPEVQQQVDQYLHLQATSGEMARMSAWDGVKHPTLGHQADLLLEGLSIGESNILGAIGLEIGRLLYPDDLERQLSVARIWGAAGSALFGVAEARGAGQQTQGWAPGRKEFESDLHASGNKPSGWGGREPNEFLGLGVPPQPPHPQATGQTSAPGPSGEATQTTGEASTPPDTRLEAAPDGGPGGSAAAWTPADANYMTRQGQAVSVEAGGSAAASTPADANYTTDQNQAVSVEAGGSAAASTDEAPNYMTDQGQAVHEGSPPDSGDNVFDDMVDDT